MRTLRIYLDFVEHIKEVDLDAFNRSYPALRHAMALQHCKTMTYDSLEYGGGYRNRTGLHGFAIRCVTSPPTRRLKVRGEIGETAVSCKTFRTPPGAILRARPAERSCFTAPVNWVAHTSRIRRNVRQSRRPTGRTEYPGGGPTGRAAPSLFTGYCGCQSSSGGELRLAAPVKRAAHISDAPRRQPTAAFRRVFAPAISATCRSTPVRPPLRARSRCPRGGPGKGPGAVPLLPPYFTRALRLPISFRRRAFRRMNPAASFWS